MPILNIKVTLNIEQKKLDNLDQFILLLSYESIWDNIRIVVLGNALANLDLLDNKY